MGSGPSLIWHGACLVLCLPIDFTMNQERNSLIDTNGAEEDLAMALWKEYPRKEQLSVETDHSEETPSRPELRYRVEERSQSTESFIGAGLTFEGKIQGAGHLRLAGRFEGTVQVDGDLNIEPGAHISGELQADTVRVGGEIHGNIHASSQVQLMHSGTLIGDLQAGSLTVAAGSRMRGKVEFGWDERGPSQYGISEEGEAE